jgi:carboxylate-amine ligase
MKAPSLTIGIEEEYQVVDPETRELRSYVTEALEDDRVLLETVQPELHASTVEVASTVCETPAEAREELVRLRGRVRDFARDQGLEIVSAGTHPFSSWQAQDITPLSRYTEIREDMAELAQRMLAFGLHVHIGIEDRDFLIDAMNVSRYFLPHLLALSTSSPFWTGRDTGLKSYRSVVWEDFPRTGIPPHVESWAAYQEMVDTLSKTGCIPDASKIWWDLRPNWNYPTLEFRVCDACTRVDEAVCIAAIVQALVAKLWKLRSENLTFRVYPESFTDENKWRAARYGLDGRLIDFGKEEELPAEELIRELIEDFLGDTIDELGTRREVEYAYRILDEGTSADRQLEVYRETGDLESVVDLLIEETREGVVD